MRVNFNGTYQDIARLVRARSTEKAPSEEFAKTLGNIPQDTELIKQSKAPSEMAVAPQPMASIRWQSPGTIKPNSERIAPPETPVNAPVNQPAPTVKTPTLVEARRISEWEADAYEKRLRGVRTLVESAGKKHGIDPALSMAVIAAESSFNPKAVSSDGHESKGLFQLLDKTGTEVLRRMSGEEKQYDPFNPEQNVELGVSYLRRLHETFSSETELTPELKSHRAANSSSLEKLAVAAFNAGEGRVASAQKRALRQGLDPTEFDNVQGYLPDITKEYVAKVMRYKSEFGDSNVG